MLSKLQVSINSCCCCCCRLALCSSLSGCDNVSIQASLFNTLFPSFNGGRTYRCKVNLKYAITLFFLSRRESLSPGNERKASMEYYLLCRWSIIYFTCRTSCCFLVWLHKGKGDIDDAASILSDSFTSIGWSELHRFYSNYNSNYVKATDGFLGIRTNLISRIWLNLFATRWTSAVGRELTME